MGTINPTSPTYSNPEPPLAASNGTVGSVRTLDLKTAFGAWVTCFIGRSVATALTRSALVAIRRTHNNTDAIPSTVYDAVSTTGAAIANTLSAGASQNATTITLTSATSFAVGDVICISPATTTRMSWNRILSISSNTLTLEAPLALAANSGDGVVTMGDVIPIWLPGGDVYSLTCINNSGQSVAFKVLAAVIASETTA